MRPPTDDRAVTVQIGTVLLFGILIVLLSVYQASVVPDQNADVEYNHNQRVHGELQDLRDELRRTGLTGSGGSSSVALGTQYPVRAFFVNPPAPVGSLATTPPANATIRNANATGETGDYWTGSARNFSTRGLVYEPGYNVYQDAPTTVYRSGVLYNRFADANVTLAGQRLVEGNDLSLVAVNGSYDATRSGTATVDLRAVSPATRTVTVRNETDADLSVVVPTDRPASEWEELLADEMNESEDDDRYVLAVEEVADRDAVRVVLEPGVYELQLAKVGVGSDASPTGPHYVTDVQGDDASVAENTTNELVVEVRDRFNNPVSDAQVSLALNSSESNDTLAYRGQSNRSFTDLRTDSEGQVAVGYEAGAFNGTTREATVNVSIVDVPNDQFDAEAKENATFDLQVYSVSGGGDGDDGDDDDDDDGDDSDRMPTVDFRVDDLSHVDRDVVTYIASYDVSNVNGSFKRVSVVYDNVDRGPWATGVNNSTDVRGNRRYELGNGTRENWNVTVRVIYENGLGEEYVAGRKSITDTADALNPSTNDDLSRTGSPSVESYSITDKTNPGQGPWYRVDYAITTNGNFSRVEGAAIGLGRGGATTVTSRSPDGRLKLQPGYESNSEFRVKLLVFDDDGAVVAVRAKTDTAN